MTAASAAPIWKLAHGRSVVLDRPRIIGILNVTPDSFSDGGRYDTTARALARAREMIEQGADMLDIGGESTRPGSERVGIEEQIARVVPVISAIREAGITAPISVDTTRSCVAEAALDAGADAVNDVAAGLEDEAMLPLVAARGAGVILMHRRVPPGQDVYSHQHVGAPAYDAEGGVVEAVLTFLRDRVRAARQHGIADSQIVIDPGLGFGKSVEQNFHLIAGTPRLMSLGVPVLSACSRKSFLGAVTGISEPSDRVAPTLAVSVTYAGMGVTLFRVHDVVDHARALPIPHRIGRSGDPRSRGA